MSAHRCRGICVAAVLRGVSRTACVLCPTPALNRAGSGSMGSPEPVAVVAPGRVVCSGAGVLACAALFAVALRRVRLWLDGLCGACRRCCRCEWRASVCGHACARAALLAAALLRVDGGLMGSPEPVAVVARAWWRERALRPRWRLVAFGIRLEPVCAVSSFCRRPQHRLTMLTSDQVRLPAEFKHISKRRKRKQP